MRLSRLRPGEWIAGIGGVALLVVMIVLDWFAIDAAPDELVGVEPGVASPNAFEAFSVIDIVLVIAAVAGIGLAVLAATNPSPNPTAPAAAITALIGIVATVLVLIRIASPPGAVADVAVTREIGVFAGLAATVAIAAGAWLSMRSEE